MVYQVLLRAYVGKQQTDAAIKTMDALENLVGKGNEADLSNVYRELGQQIGEEVKRLQIEGPKERLEAILTSFNTFLNFLYEPERRKGMSVGSLQWMAETFLNLGVGLKAATDADSKAKAAEYFKKSEDCYLAILDRAKQEKEPPKWLTGMKLRLANASRAAGNFAGGLKTIEDVLKEYPEALTVQTAAAELLQDWGFSDQPDSQKRLLEAINGRNYKGQPDPKKHGIKGWMGLTNQSDLMLRPVRSRLRELQKDEEIIIAYENTLKAKTERAARVETAKSLNEDAQAAEADLAIITDALAATKQWLELKLERERLQAAKSAGKDADKKRLDRIEQINRFLNHMIDSEYYEKLTSGALKEEYQKEIAQLEKKKGREATQKIAQTNQLLEELKQEQTLLPPAFRTGQRIIHLKEQLAVLLQGEYDQLKKSASLNPASPAVLEKLQTQIDAVKPASLDKKRAAAVQQELDSLAKEGHARTKDELQRELKMLRNAINAWTAYELVKAKITQPLDKLDLADETLHKSLRDKQTELAQQVADQEAKEAGLQARLMEVLYHVSETRHKYAKVQSSNVEKEKALRAAERDVVALTQRVPREAIPNEWWNKFNAAYKSIRSDLKPFAKDGETVDATQDLPVPEHVNADLTWLERPSNSAIVKVSDGPGEGGPGTKATPEPFPMTWVIVAVLLALGGTGGAVYFMMGAQKKKPIRVTYGAGPMGGGDDKITFSGAGIGSPAPPKPRPQRPVKKPAASGSPQKTRSPGASTGDAPRKAAPKKRPPQAQGEPPKPKPRPRPSE